jgi:hypothetical protein
VFFSVRFFALYSSLFVCHSPPQLLSTEQREKEKIRERKKDESKARPNQIKSNQIKSNQIKSNQTKPNQTKPNQIKNIRRSQTLYRINED